MARPISEIVQLCKERAGVPENQDRFDDQDIVDLIKEELEETVLPFMNSLVEEFFVFNKVEPLQDALGANRFPNLLIPIPKRAYARGIRDVQFVNSGLRRSNIPQISMEDRDIFINASMANFVTPAGFYFQNDSIALINTSSAITGNIEFSFYCRVPHLTAEDDLKALVSSIVFNSTTGQAEITVDTSSVPTGQGFSLSGSGIYDLYNVATGSYVTLDLEATISGMGAATVLSTSNIDQDTVTALTSSQSGGFPVSAPYTAQYVIVPQDINCYSPIPSELDNLLTSAVCSRLYEGLGDLEALSANMTIIKKTQEKLAKIYAVRAVGECKKAVNRRGIFNYMRRRWVRGGT